MKRLALTMVLAATPYGAGACARKQESREASVLAYVPVAPDFAAATPAALVSAAAPQGPKTCAEEDCPTLTQTLKPLFDAAAETSVAALLARVDGRLAELTGRVVDHFVPCLEEDSQPAPTKLGPTIELNPSFHCQTFYPHPTNERFSDYEHVLFSRGDAAPSHVAIRVGEADDNAASVWVQRDVAAGELDVWRATSRTLANEGKTYFKARMGADKALELTAIGLNQFSGDNQFGCGIQVRANADLLFVRGRFFPGTDISFARDPAACAALEPSDFCVQAADFTAADAAACTAAGLDAFTLTALNHEELAVETWGDAVNVDHSDIVTAFSLSGLDIY